MAIYARILQENSIPLWGLSSRERLERMLNKAGISATLEENQTLTENDTVLLLRGDFLYDQRIIVNIIETEGAVLEYNTPQGAQPVAAYVSSKLAGEMEKILCGKSVEEYPDGLRRETPETLVPVYLKQLRKIDPPYLFPITE